MGSLDRRAGAGGEGPGRDRPAAEPGRDRPAAERGRDRPAAEPGRDRPAAGPGRDRPAGEPGRDRPAAKPGRDWLEEELARARAIIEATPDIVSTSDVDGRILYYNEAGRRLLGLGPEDDVAHLKVGIGHPEWAARLLAEEGFPTAVREGVWQGETAVIDPEDREIPMLQVLIAHKDGTGEVKYFSTILRNIAERKRMEEDLHYLATRDPLTGVLNRTSFQRDLQVELKRARRPDHFGALLFLDLDNLKEVNDAYGHPAGDELLQRMSRIMKGVLREGDVLARLGGDEFAVLLPRTDKEDARRIASRLLGAIKSEAIPWGDAVIRGQASVGVAAYPDDAATAQKLLRRADAAMYEAKRRGGHRVAVCGE